MTRQEVIEQVRGELFEDYTTSNGTTCPCCDQRVKLYGWRLMASMVNALAFLTTVAGPTRRWVHMNADSVPPTVKSTRSFPKLIHWGLIEPQPDNRGWWRPTELAAQFLRGEIEVHRKVFVYNNTRVGVSEDLCTVADAAGELFDYDEMVNQPAGI